MELIELCKHLIPDNEDYSLVTQLLNDADLNARLNEDDEVYFAYIKVLEEYVWTEKTGELRSIMIKYWKENEK